MNPDDSGGSGDVTSGGDSTNSEPSRAEETRRRPYVESQVIMTTVRLISPFVLTYGIFVTLHGADSPGGGFQGGVIIASVVVMLAFSFGIGPTRDWVDDRALLALVATGVALFAVALLAPISVEGSALELGALEAVTDVDVKWWVELVEVAIGLIVAGVVVGLFFVLSTGVHEPSENGGEGSQ